MFNKQTKINKASFSQTQQTSQPIFPQTQQPSQLIFPQTQQPSQPIFPQTQQPSQLIFPQPPPPPQPNLNIDISIYSVIEKKFSSMKTIQFFRECIELNPDDLIIINNISVDSIEKLGELSVIYVKNNNNKTKLNYIFERHLELVSKIIKFNNIYSELSSNIKQIASLNLNDDEKRFTFVDICFRYKLLLCEIISDIQILIAYNSLHV